jgi:hypothetical protein
MSVLTRTEFENPPVAGLVSKNGGAVVEEPRFSYETKPLRREGEPLEEAFEHSESPDRGATDDMEAPDAGDGHLYHSDWELRHGRSRG